MSVILPHLKTEAREPHLDNLVRGPSHAPVTIQVGLVT